MHKRTWILPVFVMSGLLSGCNHNLNTLAVNDPFLGKDSSPSVASQNTASGNSRVASANEIPPPATVHWNTADGWRSASYVTHPEFVSDPMESASDPRVARITIADHTQSFTSNPDSAIRNAGYVAAKPVSAEARIQIVSAEDYEAEAHPNITVHDGLRFIETTPAVHEHPEFVNEKPSSILTREIPPFVEEPTGSNELNPFEANPFENYPAGRVLPDQTSQKNIPEWWKS
jgi:hypothetical protein